MILTWLTWGGPCSLGPSALISGRAALGCLASVVSAAKLCERSAGCDSLSAHPMVSARWRAPGGGLFKIPLPSARFSRVYVRSLSPTAPYPAPPQVTTSGAMSDDIAREVPSFYNEDVETARPHHPKQPHRIHLHANKQMRKLKRLRRTACGLLCLAALLAVIISAAGISQLHRVLLQPLVVDVSPAYPNSSAVKISALASASRMPWMHGGRIDAAQCSASKPGWKPAEVVTVSLEKPIELSREKELAGALILTIQDTSALRSITREFAGLRGQAAAQVGPRVTNLIPSWAKSSLDVPVIARSCIALPTAVSLRAPSSSPCLWTSSWTWRCKQDGICRGRYARTCGPRPAPALRPYSALNLKLPCFLAALL